MDFRSLTGDVDGFAPWKWGSVKSDRFAVLFFDGIAIAAELPDLDSGERVDLCPSL